jgi:hypothetical protein
LSKLVSENASNKPEPNAKLSIIHFMPHTTSCVKCAAKRNR